MTRPTVLSLFLNRLLSHSVLDEREQAAVLDLPAEASLVRRDLDFVDYGETVEHSCLVSEGLVGAFGQSRDGDRQITSFFVPGDMADLRSVVVPKSAQALQALCGTTIQRIRHADLRELVAAFPSVGEAFWRDSVIDADIFAQWVVNVGSRDAATRMAHVFCELGLRMERANDGRRTRFPLRMMQTHLGDALGLTAVHVNRTLRFLREQGPVSFEKGIIAIPDWERLAGLGEFDAEYLKLDGPPVRFGWFEGAEEASATA